MSRVLLKNKGGTVTLFAFAIGEGLSEHTAPFDALVVVTDGEADIEIAGESFKVSRGKQSSCPQIALMQSKQLPGSKCCSS